MLTVGLHFNQPKSREGKVFTPYGFSIYFLSWFLEVIVWQFALLGTGNDY
jgi:hypothetical protein